MTTTPAGWTAYYERNATTPPERTLVAALDRFDEEAPGAARFAVDLGCGQGRDTVELLRRGWRVLAIDADPDGVARLHRTLGAHLGDRLEVRLGRFEDQSWPEADLVNASLTLGWCAAGGFPALWQRIAGSVRPGGRFAGQFHGVHDSGGGLPSTTRLSAAEIDALVDGCDVELRTEEEEVDAMTPFGIPKRRHLHDVVARRRSTGPSGHQACHERS